MFSLLIKTFFLISKVWNYFIAWRLGNICIYSYWINVKFLQVSNYLQTKIDIPESNQLMSYKLSFFSHFITELLESVWGGTKEGGTNLSMHMFLEYLQRKLEFHQQATNVLIFWDTCFVLLFRFLLVFWLAKQKNRNLFKDVENIQMRIRWIVCIFQWLWCAYYENWWWKWWKWWENHHPFPECQCLLAIRVVAHRKGV